MKRRLTLASRLAILLLGFAAEAVESATPDIQEATKSVVSIRVYKKGLTKTRAGKYRAAFHHYQASGFVFQDRYVATSYHVVHKAKEIVVESAGGDVWTWDREEPARGQIAILQVEPDIDLAVLELSSALPSIGFSTDLVVQNTPVWSLSHPLKLQWSSGAGVISGLRPASQVHEFHKDFPLFKSDVVQFTALAAPGSSGGPLLLGDGSVIGMIMGGLDEGRSGIGLALPAATLARATNAVDSLEPLTMDQLGAVEQQHDGAATALFSLLPPQSEHGVSRPPTGWISIGWGFGTQSDRLTNDVLGPVLQYVTQMNSWWDVSSRVSLFFGSDAVSPPSQLGIFPADISYDFRVFDIRGSFRWNMVELGPLAFVASAGGGYRWEKVVVTTNFTSTKFQDQTNDVVESWPIGFVELETSVPLHDNVRLSILGSGWRAVTKSIDGIDLLIDIRIGTFFL